MATIFDTLGAANPKYGQQNKRIAKYLKNNKGKLSKKRHASLVAKQKKNHELANPIEPSTGTPERTINQTARSQTQSAYQTKWDELAKNSADTKAQQAALPGFADQWRSTLTDLAKSQIQQADLAAQQIQQQTAGIQKAETDQQATQQAALAGNRFAGDVLQGAKDAAAGRQALLGSATSFTKQQGQDAANATKAYSGTTQKWQGEQADKLSKTAKEQSTQKGDLAKAIADDFAANRQSIIGDIQKGQVNAAAAKLAGIKVAETSRHNKATEKNDAAALDQKAANDATKNQIAQQNADANWYRATHSGKGKSNGLTDTAKNSNRKKWRDIRNNIGPGGVIQVKKGTKARDLAKILRNGYTDPYDASKNIKAQTNDSFMAMAIATRVIYGGVTKNQQKVLLRDYGLRVPYSEWAERSAHPGKK